MKSFNLLLWVNLDVLLRENSTEALLLALTNTPEIKQMFVDFERTIFRYPALTEDDHLQLT